MKLQLSAAAHSYPRLALGFALACMCSTQALGQGSIEAWGWGGLELLTTVPTGSDFVEVTGGYYQSHGLRTDGSIITWGAWDQHGLISNTPTGPGFLQVSAGHWHSLALRADGSIAAWGIDGAVAGNYGQVSNTPGGTGFTRVAAGSYHSLALRSDGSIAAWGSNFHGEVFNAPPGTGFVDVQANWYTSFALRTDGTIVGWGRDLEGQISGVPSGPGFIKIAASGSGGLALRADGSVVSWGFDGNGEVSDAPGGTGFTDIAGGVQGSIALRADGSVVCWGNDYHGQVTNAHAGTGFTRVGMGESRPMALRMDHAGSAYCFGDGSGTNCPCSSNGSPEKGCANSGAEGGAKLVGYGSTQLSADTFGLHLSGAGLPGQRPGLILRGSNSVNVGLGNPIGDGLLCTSGQTARSQVQLTSTFGSTTFTDFQGSSFGASSYGIGVPTNYQCWYRDPQNTCTGMGFNFSNAWTVTWTP